MYPIWEPPSGGAAAVGEDAEEAAAERGEPPVNAAGRRLPGSQAMPSGSKRLQNGDESWFNCDDLQESYGIYKIDMILYGLVLAIVMNGDEWWLVMGSYSQL